MDNGLKLANSLSFLLLKNISNDDVDTEHETKITSWSSSPHQQGITRSADWYPTIATGGRQDPSVNSGEKQTQLMENGTFH